MHQDSIPQYPRQVLIDAELFAFNDELLYHLENMLRVDMKCPASRVTTKMTWQDLRNLGYGLEAKQPEFGPNFTRLPGLVMPGL